MSRSIEDIFLATKDILATQAKEAAEKAIDIIYQEYLPHVESDTCYNVRQEARQWLERFFADSLRDDDMKIDFTVSYSFDARKARQKIYEDNKEEIQAAIGKDLQDKIDSFRESGRHDCGYSPYN